MCKQTVVERLQHSLGFEGMFVVETQGYSGGLALLWRQNDEVTLSTYNKNHIDVKVTTKEGHNFRLNASMENQTE